MFQEPIFKMGNGGKMGEGLDHEYDPLRCHCACTRKPEHADILLRNIQSKEPSFCDEFLTGGLPAIVNPESMNW